MEEYLPFIIGIGYFIYKTYSNFQKEQQKASERNPSIPEREEEADNLYRPKKEINLPQKWGRRPEPILVEEVPNPDNPYEPGYKTVYREAKVEKHRPIISTEVITPETRDRTELVNPEKPAEEISRNRAIHKKHPHNFEVQHEQDDARFDFDLEDAIIKEAILNRPQY